MKQAQQEAPLEVLRRHWGFSAFRQPQQEVVDAVLAGQDALVVMATGGGKSLCYQVPPLVLRKPAVVISPLISLMEDQVMALNAKGIPACFLGSAQLSQQVKDDAWRGKYQFVYITPELASTAVFKLKELQKTAGLALIAVDEAHCIAEWGHDFRQEYRHLYRLREALPDVPFLALTATATPKVRDDIAANLRLKPHARKWVMSFERPNLHFSVQRKQSPLAHNFRPLLDAAARNDLEPTIIYTLTKRETLEIAAELGSKPGLKGRVAAYNGDMSVPERRRVHQAFMNDDLMVVVATVAFGMGIDKGNVRTVYHYGAQASLEAYYQQAGRAGRDGVRSTCVLLWSAADAAKNAVIKSNDYGSAEAASQRDAGTDAITAYIHTPGCRHRSMVEYFAPGAWQGVRCSGGCDNCEAAAKGGVAERDLAAEARLLLATVQRLREMGLGTTVNVLRGSRSQKMKPWMLEMTAHHGTKLHGAGMQFNDAWWKGLAGMLTGCNLLSNKTVSHPGQRAYQVVTITDAGAAFLRGSDPLVLQLSGELLAQEKAVREAAEAAAAVAAAAAAAEAARDAVKVEEQRLFRSLQDVRKAAATAAGVAPSQLLSDFSLWEIVNKRPGELAGLASCSGCSEHFIRSHGAAFVRAVVHFCGSSELLSVRDTEAAPAPGSQAGGSQSQRRHSVPAAGGMCSQAAACLSEPKAAASEAYQRFQVQGQSAAVVATTGRTKPINPATVIGYLADAANSGLPLDWERAVGEAALARDAADTIYEGILAYGAQGLGAVKRALPAAEYSQIKLVAAMVNCQQHWFGGEQGSGGGAQVQVQGQQQEGGLQPPCQQQGPGEQRLGAGAPLREITLGNGGGGVTPGEPDAKRQRTSSGGGGGSQAAMAGHPLPLLERDVVLAWIGLHGPLSGPQLAARFCGGEPHQAAQLAGILAGACADFDLARRGGSSATSEAVDLTDPEVQYFSL